MQIALSALPEHLRQTILAGRAVAYLVVGQRGETSVHLDATLANAYAAKCHGLRIGLKADVQLPQQPEGGQS